MYLSVLLSLTCSMAPPGAATAAQPPRHGGFVDVGWRALGLGGHLSHGPAFSAAAILTPYFEIGLAGFARPGPINPKTFSVRLPDGDTYRGQSTLRLRSDGSAIGLMVGARLPLRTAPIELELPVMVGYGGFGFYLHGDDRKTPDGRRVSEWENELLDGRDSDATNIVFDAGLRVAWRPARTPHLRPYLGVHYTVVAGFDTAVLSSYSGFSGAVGLRFGRFPSRSGE
ncbi:MAG: hypothetical protein AAF721_20835 [Myxococcota bacterium]